MSLTSLLLPRVRRTWYRTGLLLFCLLTGAGCAARNPPASTPAPMTPTIPIATPWLRFTATPTPTPTVTPMITPAPQVEGVYANQAVDHVGRYHLLRRDEFVEATFETTRSPVQAWARPQPQTLFRLPPEFRPPFPVLRRVAGRPVLADGSPDPTQPAPRPFRLQIEPDGRVRYLEHPEMADLSYLAYSLNLLWGTTPATCDQAALQILAEFGDSDSQPFAEFEGGRITHLAKLDLRGEIPPELGQLQHLRILALGGDGNHDTELPPELGQLQRLTYLDLTSNQLTELPPELGQLQHLIYLDLTSNQLRALPPEFGQLQHLTKLELNGNQLRALPPEFGQLQHLTELELAENQLTELPPEFGQLQHLTYLDLTSNQLRALPPELGQLQHLTKLDLIGNQLRALPPELGQLQDLAELYLAENQLTELPPEIGQLVNLNNLLLGRNQLTELPPELGQLQHLTRLELSENQVTTLPPELGQLQLTSLQLAGNPLRGCLPAGWRDQNLDFYSTPHPPFCDG